MLILITYILCLLYCFGYPIYYLSIHIFDVSTTNMTYAMFACIFFNLFHLICFVYLSYHAKKCLNINFGTGIEVTYLTPILFNLINFIDLITVISLNYFVVNSYDIIFLSLLIFAIFLKIVILLTYNKIDKIDFFYNIRQIPEKNDIL